MYEERSNSFPRRGLTKENQFVKTFGFQRPKKSLKVCIQVRASRWQAYRLHALASQASTKRLTECRIAVHDQVLLVLEKTILIVGQLEGNRLHPRFVRIGGAAREVDAARFRLHGKEEIESGQATFGPDFDRGEVNRGRHIPVRFQTCLPGSGALARWSRFDTVCFQDIADSRIGDVVADIR